MIRSVGIPGSYIGEDGLLSAPVYTPPAVPQAPQAPQYQPKVNVNPNTQINPYYMRQADTNAFAPMLAYQQYLRTGVIPQESPSRFTPMPRQQLGSQPAPTSTPAATTSSVGGK